MHSVNSLIVSLLAPLAVYAVAIPAGLVPIPPGPTCYNVPGHRAGTALAARSISLPASAPLLTLRAPASPPPSVSWCAPRSSTYLTLNYLSPLPAVDLVSPTSFLRSAHDSVVNRAGYAHNAGATLPGGHWEFHQGALGVSVSGEAMTFAAAERAMAGLVEYTTGFLAKGGWAPGQVNFAVFDGANQVGTGNFARA